TFADYSPLNKLPRVDLDARAQYKNSAEESMTTVTLHNPSSTLAFAVHLKVNRPSNRRVSREAPQDEEILPVLWQDNYFALLPGETRQVTATYRTLEKDNSVPTVEVEGWNVNHQTLEAQQ